MKKSLRMVGFLNLVWLSACATHSDWTPTTDPGRSQNDSYHRSNVHQPYYNHNQRRYPPPNSEYNNQPAHNHNCYPPACNIYDSSPGDYHKDLADCREAALRSSGGTVKETATGAVVGGLIGAAGGAAVGAIAGDAGKGAAIGAAVGGIGGGAKQGIQAEEQYKRAYSNCMRQRGHNVID